MAKSINLIKRNAIWIPSCTDYGHQVRNSSSLHGRKSPPTPKFLGTAEAYFVCQISPNFQISLIYAFIGCSPWMQPCLFLQKSRNLQKPAMEDLTEHIYFLSNNLYAKLFFIMNTFLMETFFFIFQEFLLVFGDQESFKEPAK
jgi:hypothetical protein